MAIDPRQHTRPVQPASAGAQPVRPVPTQRPSGGTAAPIPVQRGDAMPRDDVEDEEPNTWREYFKSAPAWMVSGVVHMVVLIVLGLLFLTRDSNQVELIVPHYAEEEGDLEADDLMDLDSPDPEDFEFLTPQNLPEVEDPFSAPPEVEIDPTGESSTSDITAPQIGNALNGRNEGMKRALLRKYGGNALSERAVQMALEWLAKNQNKNDGSWSLSGPYRDGVDLENRAAATAMALLAFQGAGHTHKRGSFKKNVEQGMKWLVKRQSDDGSWEINAHARFYTHGQATIALCELYGMTKDSWLKEPAEKAVKYCVATQGAVGGWRYHPRDKGSDTSVTGWILMGLQSARMAGLDVPQATFDKIGKYLDRATTNGGSMYGYLPDTDSPKRSMTAEGLLCRQYLGWPRNHEQLQKGVEHLLSRENLPDMRDQDVYYWYYATQVMHHMEGKPWTTWNDIMRDMLVKAQEKNGKERGSWPPHNDEWGPHAGRLYVTCLSVYMLEVYYRHLPIYATLNAR